MDAPPPVPAASTVSLRGRRGTAWLGLLAALLAAGGALGYVLHTLGRRADAERAREAEAGLRAAAEARAETARQAARHGEREAAALAEQLRREGAQRAAAEARARAAEGERDLLRTARAGADGALSVLLQESRAALLALGREAVLERCARAALEAQDGWDPEHLPAEALEARLAAQSVLGEVLLRREQGPEAEEAWRQAVATARCMGERAAGSAARRFALTEAQRGLGRALGARGRAAEACEVQHDALLALRTLVGAPPANAAARAALAGALREAAVTLGELGRPAEGVAYVEEALALLGELAEADGDDASLARARAGTAATLADLLLLEGELEAALRACARAEQLLTPLAAAPDAGSDLGADLVDLLRRKASVQEGLGRAGDSVETLREALVVAVPLAQHDPTRADMQVRLAQVCDELCAVLEQNGEWDDALVGRREVVAIWRRVADLEGGPVERQQAVLRALRNLGDHHAARGALAEARAAYEQGVAQARALGERAEGQAAYGSDLALLSDRLAGALLAAGRRAEALEAWRAALEAIEPLAKRTPENAFWQADLARVWWRLGLALGAEEPDRPEALRALKRAQRLLQGLVDGQRLPGYAAAWPAAVADDLRVLAAGTGPAGAPETAPARGAVPSTGP